VFYLNLDTSLTQQTALTYGASFMVPTIRISPKKSGNVKVLKFKSWQRRKK